MKRKALFRALCCVLCAATLLAAAGPLSAGAIPSTAGTPSSVKKVDPDPGLYKFLYDFFFRNFGLIGFTFDPYQTTIINQKPVFQFGLGFNEIYDLFPWVVNVWTDTIRCEFNYGGKDWLVQLWKGGYGLFLATGGEIGVYVKSEDQALAHYSASLSQSDWLNLRYTIFNRGQELFTRPSPYLTGDEPPYWWASGYRILSICTDFLSSPRANVVMDATIELKDADMAKQFIKQLQAKGFKALEKGGKLGLSTPETYALQSDKKSVRLVWQNINEGLY